MPSALPIPSAHTVPDLRVGMLVTVCDQRDVDRLRGALLRADARLGDHMSLEGTVVSVEPARASEGQGFNVVVMRGHHNGEVRVVAPVRCKVVSLPRGETVDASELQVKPWVQRAIDTNSDAVVIVDETPDFAHFHAAVKQETDRLRAAMDRLKLPSHDEASVSVTRLYDESMDAYRKRLGSIAAMAEQRGVKVSVDEHGVTVRRDSLFASPTPEALREAAKCVKFGVRGPVDVDAFAEQMRDYQRDGVTRLYDEPREIPWVLESLRAANARAASLDAGNGDSAGKLAAMVRPSVNVHDEVTIDAQRLREAEPTMAAYFDRWPALHTTASANAGAVKVTSFPARATWTAEEVKAMQASVPDLRVRYEEELRAAEKRAVAYTQPQRGMSLQPLRTDTSEREEWLNDDATWVPAGHGLSTRLPNASEVVGLRAGMEVGVHSREDVEALVGREICVQSYAGTTERHGLPCVATVTGYREVEGAGEVSRVCATSFGPFKLPLVCTLRYDVVQAAGQKYARRVPPSYPNRIKSVQATTRSRCSDCKDTGILPGFGFGTSIDACDRPCSCDAGKRKAEGDGPSEWTVVKREVQREPLMIDGSYSAEHVTVQRGQQVVRFRVVAHHEGDFYETEVFCNEVKYAGSEWGRTALLIRGEACIPMAIDRLLVGLREGTVVL